MMLYIRFIIPIFLIFQSGYSQVSSRMSPSEYEVKVAFLYHFAKFVDWPDNQDLDSQPIVIGVLGKDPFGNILEEVIESKMAKGRKLVLKRFAFCDTYPIRDQARNWDDGFPNRRMSPLWGCSSPRITLINVDFPEPLGPTSPKNSPRFTARLTFSNTFTAPYANVTSRTSIIGSSIIV